MPGTGNPLYARLGLTVTPSGSAAQLALSIGGMGLSDPTRTGFYYAVGQHLGIVHDGTEVLRVEGVLGRLNLLGSLRIQNHLQLGSMVGAPVAGAIQWTGVDFEGYNGATWISLTTGSGGGGVSAVGLALPVEFTVTGSPVTTSGTLSASWANQPAGTVLAAPGLIAGAPSFRALLSSDLPNVPWTRITAAPTTLAGYGITDAAQAGPIGSSGLTVQSGHLLGRGTAGTGPIEQLTIGSGLQLTGTILSAIASGQNYFQYDNLVSAATVWTITHPLGYYPSVTVLDQSGILVIGEVTYPAPNQVQLVFLTPLMGTAYLS